MTALTRYSSFLPDKYKSALSGRFLLYILLYAECPSNIPFAARPPCRVVPAGVRMRR